MVNKSLMIFTFIFINVLAIDDIDFVIIRNYKGPPYGKSECKLIFNINDIIFIEKSLHKSTSLYYACGWRYVFDFVNENRIIKSSLVQPDCENQPFLNEIKYYFPDSLFPVSQYLRSRTHQI